MKKALTIYFYAILSGITKIKFIVFEIAVILSLGFAYSLISSEIFAENYFFNVCMAFIYGICILFFIVISVVAGFVIFVGLINTLAKIEDIGEEKFEQTREVREKNN